MSGWQALFYKEVLRFWKVGFQTVAAPVITAILYLMIFGHVLEGRVQVYDTVGYTAFLLPGLVMMSVLQNAFANSSSSLIQSKIMGNLVFLLLTPLSHWAWYLAYVGSSVLRGLVVGSGVFLDKIVPAVEYTRANMQVAHMIHGTASVLMMALFMGHIYMGTLGMDGAYKAMKTGYVDETWAKEHHELWYNDIKAGKIPAQRSANSPAGAVASQPVKA